MGLQCLGKCTDVEGYYIKEIVKNCLISATPGQVLDLFKQPSYQPFCYPNPHILIVFVDKDAIFVSPRGFVS